MSDEDETVRGDTAEYSIIGGDPLSQFFIDRRSGLLFFVTYVTLLSAFLCAFGGRTRLWYKVPADAVVMQSRQLRRPYAAQVLGPEDSCAGLPSAARRERVHHQHRVRVPALRCVSCCALQRAVRRCRHVRLVDANDPPVLLPSVPRNITLREDWPIGIPFLNLTHMDEVRCAAVVPARLLFRSTPRSVS